MSSSANTLRSSSISYTYIALMVIAVIHVVGIVGLNSLHYHDIFERTASLTLLLGFCLMIIFHRPFDLPAFGFYVFSFSIGMIAEIVGIHSGYPFGSYYYTPSFGWQAMGVPVIIGVNWALLSYLAGTVVFLYFYRPWLRVLAAALLMACIDLLLERFAIRHHFWVWRDGYPPVQNYSSWFGISLIIECVFVRLIPAPSNIFARYYFIILVSFLFLDFILSSLHRTF